jgi:small-conductance mechanosensitive channel
MTEEFDALLTFDLLSSIGLALAILVLGLLLEVGLRLAQRWVAARERQLAGVILGALRWQPIVWSILFAFAWLLSGFSDVSVERQLGTRIFLGLLTISLTIVTVRILTGWLKIQTAKRPAASVSILNYLVNGLAIAIVVIVGLYAFNVPVTLQLATLAGSALGLSLALREPLANLFAGVVLTVSDRLRPGDFVRLPSGEQGRILDIGWDVTSIQQLRNSLIIVPNSVMNQAEIINFDRPTREFELPVDVGVGYDSDLEDVERITIEVADGVLRDMFGGEPAVPPYIRYRVFRDSDIMLTVYLTCSFADRVQTRHEFMKRLHRRYEEDGIEMPSPSRTLNTQPDEPLRIILGSTQSTLDLGASVQATAAVEGGEEEAEA